MQKKERLTGIALPVILAALGALASSCEPAYDALKMEDYIGPASAGARPTTGPASLPASQPAAGLPEIPPTGAVPLDVSRAIVLALSNNKALVVDKYNPPIQRTLEQQQLGVFDPTLTGAVSSGRSRSDQTNIGGANTLSKSGNAQLGLQEFLPTGTTLGLTGNTNFSGSTGADDQFVSRLGLSATQALLQGFGLDVNLVSLRQARLSTLSSQYELRGLAESIVAQTEEAYWDYTLAQRQIEIVTQSLALAQQQLDETNERIRVGRLAETERAAAEAEAAVRRENLINARSALDKARLALLRLISPPGGDALGRDVLIQQQPVAVQIPLDKVEDHLQVAYRMRPDLNQARLQVKSGDLQIVKTRNGLLPQLDLFITLGKTGYADSFSDSWGDISSQSYDLTVGLTGQYQLTNRTAKAQYLQSVLGRDQSVEALNNLTQLVELDVRNSYIEIVRLQEQVAATAVSRKLQEVSLQTETEKFRIGRSTSLQVAQVQRDLLVSQIAEIQAVVGYLKGFVELYRLEGSLLSRRGIASPGAQPVEPDSPQRLTGAK